MSDPYFNRVGLLIHGDGAANGTVFTDSSQAAQPITAYGGAKTVTDASFPLGSAIQLLANANLTLPADTKYFFGTTDFSIEVRMKSNQPSASYVSIIGCNNASTHWGTWSVRTTHAYSNSFGFAFNDNGSWINIPTYINVNDGQPHDLGVFREAGVFYLFVDGVLRETDTRYKTNNVGTAVYLLDIGKNPLDNTWFEGLLGEVRITFGKARHTLNYTPEATSLSNQQTSVNITLTESIAANDFEFSVYDLGTKELINQATVQSGQQDIASESKEPVFITFMPKQGYVWKANTSYAVNALVFPLNPVDVPYYYKRLVAGVSGVTEPSWTTVVTAQCADGGYATAWECIGLLSSPVTIGPILPI